MEGVGLLFQIGVMIIAASVFALLARKLKQPLIFGYLLAGILLGPAVFGVIDDPGPLIWLSELALVFLLFVIGLQLDLNRLKEVGKISVVIGTFQVAGVTCMGIVGGQLLGLSLIESIYFGLIAAFSSTILVSKLLDERREMNSLTGELTMGILIVQDILAVFALVLLGAFTQSNLQGSDWTATVGQLLGLEWMNQVLLTAGVVVVSGALFVLVTYLLFKYVFPPIFKYVMGNNELLFLISLASVFLLSMIAGAFKFSIAVGSFAAGMVLSSTAYSHEVVTRVRPLKDFFLTLFFVLLGVEVVFQGLGQSLWLIVLLFLISFVGNPLVTFFLFKLFKYNNYTAFLSSIHLAQMGEFGLILVASAVFAGGLPASFLSMAIIGAIGTMTVSTYLITYDRAIYDSCKNILAPLERWFGTSPEEFRNVPEKYSPEIVIFGVTPVTAEVIKRLKKRRLLVIDYNPARARAYESQGVPTICSDAIDLDLYETIDFSAAEMVVSVIHETSDAMHGPSSNTFLMRKIRQVNKHAVLVVTAQSEDEGERFYKAGATIVLTPSIMGKRLLKELIEENDLSKLRGLGLVFYEELHDDVPFQRES